MAIARATTRHAVAVSLALLLSVCGAFPLANQGLPAGDNSIHQNPSQCSQCDEQFTDETFDQVTATLADNSPSWRELPYDGGKLQRYDTLSDDSTIVKARLCFTVSGVPSSQIIPLFSYKERRSGCDNALQSHMFQSCPNYEVFYSVHKFSPLRVDRDFLQASAVKLDTEAGCATIVHQDVTSASATAQYPADNTNSVIRGTTGLSGVRVCSADGGLNTDVCILVNYDIKEQLSLQNADLIAHKALSRWHAKVTGCSKQTTDSTTVSLLPAHLIPDHVIDELIATEYHHSTTNGWKTVAISDKASTYYKHWVGTTTYAFKSFYKVSIPACTLTKIITNYSVRGTWDITFPKVSILHKGTTGSDIHIIYWLLGLTYPYNNRDVVLYSKIVSLPTAGYAIVYVNAKHNQRLPHPGITRAIAYPSAIFVHPDPDDPIHSSLLSYNMHMDLGKGIRPAEYEALLQGRNFWVKLVDNYYNKLVDAGTLSDIQSDFDIAC